VSAAAATLPRRRVAIARRFVDDAGGFGLVELLIALMVMNVGIFATVAALNAGTLTLRRANTTATASVLAAKQMELYRALLYDNIAVLAPASPCDTTYCSDSKYAGSITSATCPPADPPEACQPITDVTGPDHSAYRVDTYLRLRTESAGLFPARAVKVITVVVRDGRTKAALVRTESTFDRATAS
jgi:competence protein ComGC